MDLGRSESARGTPDLANDRAGDPGARSATRRACATSFAKRASPSLERFGPRLASRRSWLAGLGAATHRKANATGIGWCRQLACEGRRLVGCARASYTGCRSRQASPRLERSAYPVATERVNGSPADGPERATSVKRRRQPVSRWQSRVAGAGRSRALERASQGEGPCSYGRHPGPFSHTYRFTRAVGGGLGGDHRDTERASATGHARAATGVSEARPHTWRGEDNAPRDERETGRCGPPKRDSLA